MLFTFQTLIRKRHCMMSTFQTMKDWKEPIGARFARPIMKECKMKNEILESQL